MKTTNFDEVLQVLSKLDAFLISLGIPIRDDRWHKASETVRQARDRGQIGASGGAPPATDNYVDGLFEALEIYQIRQAFEGVTSDGLRTKVARAVSGPPSPLAEQPKNNEARNAMFELCLAADWKNAGMIVEIGEPDIQVRFGSDIFKVECKRPFSENSVWRNIEQAHSQLKEALNRPRKKTDVGIIAVSLSRTFTKGNLMLHGPAEAGRSAIRAALAKMLRDNANDWGLHRRYHERVVALMFYLAVPWDIDGARLIHLSTSDFRGTGRKSKGRLILEENFAHPGMERNRGNRALFRETRRRNSRALFPAGRAVLQTCGCIRLEAVRREKSCHDSTYG